MSAAPPDIYLRNAVLTATPEQLQLMLYDGAIRFASQGREAILSKNPEVCYERFSRAQKIILQLEAGLNHDVNPELCRQMAALYNFIYRRLIDASIHKDVQAADDALRILHDQRETWVLLMEKLKAERAAAAGGTLVPKAEPSSEASSSTTAPVSRRPSEPVEGALCVEG